VLQITWNLCSHTGGGRHWLIQSYSCRSSFPFISWSMFGMVWNSPRTPSCFSLLNVCLPHSFGTRVSLSPWHMNRGGNVVRSCGKHPTLCNRTCVIPRK
jgi:hypothetical protein